MNKQKQYALNKLFNACVAFGLFFVWGAIEFFKDNDIAWGSGFSIAGFLLIVLPAIFTPYCYAFDHDGVSLCYVFFPRERYLWKDIHAIEVDNKKIVDTSKVSIFEFFYASVFHIKGSTVGESRFYMNGHIRKSFRTKQLLEQYWDGTITGYLFEDIQQWFDKRKAKKQSQIKAHLTDEVVPMEREIRAEVRELLKPFLAQANQHTLDVKTKYLYTTNDRKQWYSRPKDGYTYTLVAEISRLHKTDDSPIDTVSVDLLYVRLGKTAYRGVKNKHLQNELDYAFSDVLNGTDRQ